MLTQIKRLFPVTLMLLALSGVAEAGPRGGGPGGEMGPPLFRQEVLDRVADELNLDDTTHQKLSDMAYKAQQDMTRMEADVKLQRMALKRLLDQDKPNENEVVKALEALNKTELELRKQRTLTLLNMRAQLTPEQRKQLKALHEERMKERGGRGERGGEGKGGRGAGGPNGAQGGGRGMGAPFEGPDDGI